MLRFMLVWLCETTFGGAVLADLTSDRPAGLLLRTAFAWLCAFYGLAFSTMRPAIPYAFISFIGFRASTAHSFSFLIPFFFFPFFVLFWFSFYPLPPLDLSSFPFSLLYLYFFLQNRPARESLILFFYICIYILPIL